MWWEMLACIFKSSIILTCLQTLASWQIWAVLIPFVFFLMGDKYTNLDKWDLTMGGDTCVASYNKNIRKCNFFPVMLCRGGSELFNIYQNPNHRKICAHARTDLCSRQDQTLLYLLNKSSLLWFGLPATYLQQKACVTLMRHDSNGN